MPLPTNSMDDSVSSCHTQVMPSTMKPYDFIPTSAFTDLGNVLEEAGSEKREEQLLPGTQLFNFTRSTSSRTYQTIKNTFRLRSQASWSSATKRTSPRGRTKSASALPLALPTTCRSSAPRYNFESFQSFLAHSCTLLVIMG